MEQTGLMQYTLYHETPKGSSVTRYKLSWIPLTEVGNPITQELDLASMRKGPGENVVDLVEAEMNITAENLVKAEMFIAENKKFPVGDTLEELAQNSRKNSYFSNMYQGEQFITLPGRTFMYFEVDVFEGVGEPVSPQELAEFQRLFLD